MIDFVCKLPEKHGYSFIAYSIQVFSSQKELQPRLSAGVAFCHVNVSRWGNPPRWGPVHVTFVSTSRSFTPGPWGRKFACKRGLFLDHANAGYLTFLVSPTSM